MRPISLILILTLFISCKTNRNKEIVVTKSDTEILETLNKKIYKKTPFDTLTEANNLKNKRILEFISRELKSNDTLYIITDSLVVNTNYFFTNNIKHSYVNFENLLGNFIQIRNRDKIIFEEQTYHSNYIQDKISDVNRDGFNDFVVLWYPSSGCCLANMYDVYLYNHLKDTLQFAVELINPTFFPKESVVRCVGYGWPGEMSVYTIVFNGFTADTTEILENIGDSIPIITVYNIKKCHTDTVYSLPNEYIGVKDINLFLSEKIRGKN